MRAAVLTRQRRDWCGVSSKCSYHIGVVEYAVPGDHDFFGKRQVRCDGASANSS